MNTVFQLDLDFSPYRAEALVNNASRLDSLVLVCPLQHHMFFFPYDELSKKIFFRTGHHFFYSKRCSKHLQTDSVLMLHALDKYMFGILLVSTTKLLGGLSM